MKWPNPRDAGTNIPHRLSDWDLTMLILENQKLIGGLIGAPSPFFAPLYGEVGSTGSSNR